jgi:hypothetical protein
MILADLVGDKTILWDRAKDFLKQFLLDEKKLA